MSAPIVIVSVDLDSDEFETSINHNLTTGDAVKLSAEDPPDSIIDGARFYVRVITPTTFSIHLTANDAKNNLNRIDVTSQGTNVTFFLVTVPKLEIYEFSKTVFGKPITTSPTFIFTDSSPRAAPGPEQIKEYWFLT